MPKVLARGVNAVAKSASSHRRYKKGKLRFSKTAHFLINIIYTWLYLKYDVSSADRWF